MRRFFLALGLAIFGAPGLPADTVLVLPFFNYSKLPNLDWIGEGIAVALQESLASGGVLVLDREDRMEAYRRLSVRANAPLTRATVMKLGEAVDASHVLYGRFEVTPAADEGAKTSAASLRLVARILDLKRMRQGPEFAVGGALDDLVMLETRLGWQALAWLAPRSAPSEQDFLRERPPVRLDAMENYVRGLLASSPEQKHRFFNLAVRLDERFSQPRFQLGRMYWEKKDYAVAAGWFERVTRADSHFLESRFLLGLCKYNLGDFAAAQANFLAVAASVPLNEVWNNLGAAQSRLKLPAAVESFRKALEGDDADPDYHFNLGYALWKSGDFAAAADAFRATLDRKPEDNEATSFLGRCLKKEGPRAGDPRSEGRERLKLVYEETAYRQLKAELESR